MLGFLSKFLGGNKSEKDVKKILPIVESIKKEYEALASLSNDELRGKTVEFRDRIHAYLKPIDEQITELNANAEALPAEALDEKDKIYQQVDGLKKDRNQKLEEVLNQILPQAFAVVKETARRFKENTEIASSATDLDRQLAVGKPYIQVSGDQVVFKNSWMAAGNQVTWNMLHYDVQLIGGIVLHQGKISEMATGEGKTLVSTLPAYLNALAGEGVHLVTVNDYLARRDQEWNGPIFEWLGLRVDCIDKHSPNTEARRNAYRADITYGTNNEFGFDYLRDNMVQSPTEMVQRQHHYAMVDEVDSVLIDDARTPLIIAGPVTRGSEDQQYEILKPRVASLVAEQEKRVREALTEARKRFGAGDDDPKSGGLYLFRAHRGLPKYGPLIKFLNEPGNRVKLQRAENYYIADQSRHMHIVDEELLFQIDEKNKSVDLTEKGLNAITRAGEDPEFFVIPDISTGLDAVEKLQDISADERLHRKEALLNDYQQKADRIHSVQQLLKSYALFEKDVEYVVMDGQVKIVDEQTGRIMEGRRYSDGLHQAIEAKENVKIEAATQTYATITLQNYFRMYHKLAGMTGTAETEAAELWSIYKLDVVTIPTNIPITRIDHQDRVYKTKREKYAAVIEEVEAMRQAQRPVLVGTTSVEVSELLSRMLHARKIPHNVLNAKQHAQEARVVAEAGLPGAVTIATNMAGRGTDIKLGPGVKESGGLAIIGTERHESRRVDRQLRGRAGRQGDPGSSLFFVALDDDLMRMFGSERIAGMMDRFGYKEGDMIQHSMITKSIERAQRKVEENNFGIRKRLLEYDDVMNKQRNAVYQRRNHALFGDRLALDTDNAFMGVAEDTIAQFKDDGDFDNFKLACLMNLGLDTQIGLEDLQSGNQDQLSQRLYEEAMERYRRHKELIANEAVPVFGNIRTTQGAHIENVVVPFSDGRKIINVLTSLDKTLQTNGVELANAMERTITLAIIDDTWKEHLRAMDDLKQSVQTAYLEQKDPLVIYKGDAFKLFRVMSSEVNREIVSFLTHSMLPMPEEAPQMSQQAPLQQPMDMSQLTMNKEEIDAAGQDYAANERDYFDPTEEVAVKQQPIKAGPKIGRNDPCPCGSGKKFKNCHGKDA